MLDMLDGCELLRVNKMTADGEIYDNVAPAGRKARDLPGSAVVVVYFQHARLSCWYCYNENSRHGNFCGVAFVRCGVLCTLNIRAIGVRFLVTAPWQGGGFLFVFDQGCRERVKEV